MPTEQERLRAAVFAMTPEQVRASWVREQEWNRARGLPHYTRLIDPATGKVVAHA